jgi:hypothetical protein
MNVVGGPRQGGQLDANTLTRALGGARDSLGVWDGR